MNAFEYRDLLPPLLLGVANLFFAGILHRAIVRNSALLRRRHFFESLAALAFAVALILLVAGFVLWDDNPRFVLVCSGVWLLGCSVAAVALRHRNRRQAGEELTLPDVWPSSSAHPSGAQHSDELDRRDTASPHSGDASRERAVPLDAFTRARLKKARRERSSGNGRFRMNRSVYVEEEPDGNKRPDHKER